MLLIVGGAALAGLLALRLDSREPVLVLTQDVPAGTEITSEMLGSTRVASEGLSLIPEDDASGIVGKTYARTSLNAGQLLDTNVLTTTEPFGTDEVRLGVSLTAGQVPLDLKSGDEVRIVRLGDGSNPVQPLAVGLVLDVDQSDGGGGLSGGSSSSSASLLVPARASDAVIDAAGNELLGMALIRRGVQIEDAQLLVLEGS
ncbi:MAG: SAF domain-containing protein [Aeromicrobium sp.]